MQIAYDPKRPLWYLHVIKCFGQSTRVVWEQWFAQKDWKTFVHDHFRSDIGAGVEDRVEKHAVDPQMVTLLREPFEWVQSLYHYLRGVNYTGEFTYNGKVWNVRQDFKDLEHFMRDNPHDIFDYLPAGAKPKDVLDRLSLVGTTDRVHDFMRTLGNWCGKTYTGNLPHNNATAPYRNQVHLRATYEKLRPEYFELYELARERFLASK